MPTKIYSMGFRHGHTLDGRIVKDAADRQIRKDPQFYGDAMVLDVRGWLGKNPYHDRKLRKLRGTDKAVQDEIQLTPGFKDSLMEIMGLAAGHPGPVYLACTGGHHRSVYMAILLGRALALPVIHLDLDK